MPGRRPRSRWLEALYCFEMLPDRLCVLRVRFIANSTFYYGLAAAKIPYCLATFAIQLSLLSTIAEKSLLSPTMYLTLLSMTCLLIPCFHCCLAFSSAPIAVQEFLIFKHLEVLGNFFSCCHFPTFVFPVVAVMCASLFSHQAKETAGRALVAAANGLQPRPDGTIPHR